MSPYSLLRDSGQKRLSANALFSSFQSPDNKRLRKAYCRYNFRFRDFHQFEAALYSLDHEDKLYYDGKDTVIYTHGDRVDEHLETSEEMRFSEDDECRAVRTFVDAFEKEDMSEWIVTKLARIARRFRSAEVEGFLRDKLTVQDLKTRARALIVINGLASE